MYRDKKGKFARDKKFLKYLKIPIDIYEIADIMKTVIYEIA